MNSSTGLQLQEIERFRHVVLQLIGETQRQKGRLNTSDYTNLLNHYHFILTIYDNLINIRKAEDSNPYNPQRVGQNGYTSAPLSVVYNRDGSTRLVQPGQRRPTQEWETQFEENVMNPPCYLHPPSNVWNIDQIKKMPEPRRI